MAVLAGLIHMSKPALADINLWQNVLELWSRREEKEEDEKKKKSVGELP